MRYTPARASSAARSCTSCTCGVAEAGEGVVRVSQPQTACAARRWEAAMEAMVAAAGAPSLLLCSSHHPSFLSSTPPPPPPAAPCADSLRAARPAPLPRPPPPPLRAAAPPAVRLAPPPASRSPVLPVQRAPRPAAPPGALAPPASPTPPPAAGPPRLQTPRAPPRSAAPAPRRRRRGHWVQRPRRPLPCVERRAVSSMERARIHSPLAVARPVYAGKELIASADMSVCAWGAASTLGWSVSAGGLCSAGAWRTAATLSQRAHTPGARRAAAASISSAVTRAPPRLSAPCSACGRRH